jgi:hypothetical protein
MRASAAVFSNLAFTRGESTNTSLPPRITIKGIASFLSASSGKTGKLQKLNIAFFNGTLAFRRFKNICHLRT